MITSGWCGWSINGGTVVVLVGGGIFGGDVASVVVCGV